MERAPLPPHERPWRHPSELAADTRLAICDERPSGSARTAALVGGTATIVLFAVAMLSFTPATSDGPAATGSSPIRSVAAVTLTVPSTIPAGARLNGSPGTGHDAHSILGPSPVGPLATTIDSTGLAVMPSRTVLDVLRVGPADERLDIGPRIDVVRRVAPTAGPSIVVTLHDGSTTRATVLDMGDGTGLAVVRVDAVAGSWAAAGRFEFFEVADAAPAPEEFVTVLGDEPISVEWRQIDGVDPAVVGHGAAVLDAEGGLIGIYASGDRPGEHGLIPIDDAVATAASRD